MTQMIFDSMRPAGASAIRLVCLDFDGTIMCYDEPPGCFHPDVIKALNALSDRGIAWCTNSGRDLEDQLRVLDAAMQRGLTHKPTALLCSESVIFEKSNGTYLAAEPWNTQTLQMLQELHGQIFQILSPELEDICRRYGQCPYYFGRHYTAFNVVDRDGLPIQLFDELRGRLSAVKGCKLTRNGGWVAVIGEGLGKGAILKEYAGRAGYKPDEILAIGDHFNDLDMLDGAAARHVGCPSNSIPEVMNVVRTASGCVALAEGPLGTLEVLEFFLSR